MLVDYHIQCKNHPTTKFKSGLLKRPTESWRPNAKFQKWWARVGGMVHPCSYTCGVAGEKPSVRRSEDRPAASLCWWCHNKGDVTDRHFLESGDEKPTIKCGPGCIPEASLLGSSMASTPCVFLWSFLCAHIPKFCPFMRTPIIGLGPTLKNPLYLDCLFKEFISKLFWDAGVRTSIREFCEDTTQPITAAQLFMDL